MPFDNLLLAPFVAFLVGSGVTIRATQAFAAPLYNHVGTVQSQPRFTVQARRKSKWDCLDEEDEANDRSSDVPLDMTYTERNICRQASTYDQLEQIGGKDVISDVYVRATGEKEWWLVGKVARVSDVSPEQAIERQWPLIERHVWALRIPVRPSFEVWYAAGDSEYDAAKNDPKIKFTKVSGLLLYNGEAIKASLCGFVGKAYKRGEPIFFVERNVVTGEPLKGQEMEGDWVLKSEIQNDD
jgi:hypothetical protein